MKRVTNLLCTKEITSRRFFQNFKKMLMTNRSEIVMPYMTQNICNCNCRAIINANSELIRRPRYI